jgi:hypothetical protein
VSFARERRPCACHRLGVCCNLLLCSCCCCRVINALRDGGHSICNAATTLELSVNVIKVRMDRMLQFQRFLTAALDDVIISNKAAQLAREASYFANGAMREQSLTYVAPAIRDTFAIVPCFFCILGSLVSPSPSSHPRTPHSLSYARSRTRSLCLSRLFTRL